jgi:hypothetical protein
MLFLVVVSALAVFPAPGRPSGLLARNVAEPSLEVDGVGRALVTYRSGATVRRVLVWGAVDALPPTPGTPQVGFRFDDSGGKKAFGRPVWRTFRDRCGPYDGPPLAWLLVACKAPDGTYWALQSWQRTRPFHGEPPSKSEHDAWELRISHWSGELAKVEVWQDWKYSARFESLFGRYTYRGAPVTNPQRGTDGWRSYVRRAHIDTFNSGYGPGWWRAEVLSAHPPNGTFCAIFAKQLTDRFGTNRAAGERYRVTMTGPGVTPDVMWEGASLGPWDSGDPVKVEHEATMNALMASLGDTDPRCLEP